MLPGIWMSVNRSLMSERDLEQSESVVGIDRFKSSEARILHDVDRAHAQHQFVFDHKDRGLCRGLIESHNCRTLSCGAKEKAVPFCSLWLRARRRRLLKGVFELVE